jgi:hypothetical protein
MELTKHSEDSLDGEGQNPIKAQNPLKTRDFEGSTRCG